MLVHPLRNPPDQDSTASQPPGTWIFPTQQQNARLPSRDASSHPHKAHILLIGNITNNFCTFHEELRTESTELTLRMRVFWTNQRSMICTEASGTDMRSKRTANTPMTPPNLYSCANQPRAA